MSNIILLTGPTAVGKTELSIKLAKYLDAEIINADSRYFYKEPSIATAKVTKNEMNGVIHHMIDIISLNDDYSIYEYQKEARKIIDGLINKNKNIIITGGSGLYIKALLYDYDLKEKTKNSINLDNMSNRKLKSMLDRIDPLNEVHINNRQRLERYINSYYESGNVSTKKKSKELYNFIPICLITDRETLYDRINRRVDIMIKKGLLDEAKILKDYKHFNEIIGYKELNLYFDNIITLDEAIDKIKIDTRHYAKRQFTWFRTQMNNMNYVNVKYDNLESTFSDIINIIEMENKNE